MKKNVRQRLSALLLACVMALGLCTAALAADPVNHVIVNQVYGGSAEWCRWPFCVSSSHGHVPAAVCPVA